MSWTWSPIFSNKQYLLYCGCLLCTVIHRETTWAGLTVDCCYLSTSQEIGCGLGNGVWKWLLFRVKRKTLTRSIVPWICCCVYNCLYDIVARIYLDDMFGWWTILLAWAWVGGRPALVKHQFGCPAWQPRPKCTAVLVPCVTDVSIWHCIVGRVVCLGYIKVNIIIIIIICAMYIGCCSQCTIWATVHMAPTDRRINMCPDSGLRLSSVGSVWSWLGLVLVVVCLSVTIIVVMMIVGIAVYTIG